MQFQISEMESQISQMQFQISQMESQISQMQFQISQMQSQISQMQSQISVLERVNQGLEDILSTSFDQTSLPLLDKELSEYSYQ